MPAGPISTTGGAANSDLVSVFCVPPTFNGVVDTAGDLPGPGAACLQGDMQLLGPPPPTTSTTTTTTTSSTTTTT